MIVVPGPARAAEPLVSSRRADSQVVSDGIIARIVKEVRPFVDFFRPGLEFLCPLITIPDVCQAFGNQDTHYFIVREIANVLRHNKIDHIVDIGQSVSTPPFGGDLAVKIQRADMLAGFFNVFRIVVQAVDHKSVVGAQRRGELSVAAADMDD